MIVTSTITEDSGIYEITCKDYVYVGQAQNFQTRVFGHLSSLRRNVHHNPVMQNLWNKYGPEAFTFSVKELTEIDQLNEREGCYLRLLKETISEDRIINFSFDPAAPHRGMKVSEEGRRRMSEAKKGRPSTFRGCTHSEEARAKMSAAARKRPPNRKGCIPWNKGKKQDNAVV